jgi:phage gp36-like protein
MDVVAPGTKRSSSLEPAPVGLLPTLSWRLKNVDDGSIVIPVAGVFPDPLIVVSDAGTGYFRDFDAPAPLVDARYLPIWNDGTQDIEDVESAFKVSLSVITPVGPGYVSVADVREVLSPGGSTDPTLGDAASLSDQDIQDAINDAHAQVEGRLAQRYTVPFADPPVLVMRIESAIAAYLATLSYRRGTPIDQTHPLSLRYGRATALLDQAATGKLDLVDAAAPTEVTQTAVADVENMYEGTLFDVSTFGLGVDGRPVPWWEGGGDWGWS